jgi:hypothetical protein
MKQLENVLVSVLHVVVYQQEGPEGVKWELGFAYSWPGKYEIFIHWNWDSPAIKQ